MKTNDQGHPRTKGSQMQSEHPGLSRCPMRKPSICKASCFVGILKSRCILLRFLTNYCYCASESFVTTCDNSWHKLMASLFSLASCPVHFKCLQGHCVKRLCMDRCKGHVNSKLHSCHLFDRCFTGNLRTQSCHIC